MLRNLLASGFAGPVHPVNPAADSVQSVPAFPSVGEIPEDVDLAVLAVTAEATADGRARMRRQGRAQPGRPLRRLRRGRRGGRRARTRAARASAARRGCGWSARTASASSTPTPTQGSTSTFAPTRPPAGNVGFATQSGALGLALIDFAAARGLGVSSFASVGNRADMTANDLLEFWEEDERTRLALLYIESFSDPRRFARVARRVGRQQAGRRRQERALGGRAPAPPSSHTGALLAASDRATDALFEQSGVIRAETLAELLDVASLLSSQPLPAGPRVGILTNAGGPAIMCADACEAAGSRCRRLPEQVRERAARLPAGGGIARQPGRHDRDAPAPSTTGGRSPRSPTGTASTR